MSKRGFPVLFGHDRHERSCRVLGCPAMVEWSLVAPHEEQALKNHGQTLQRLAARGGLSPAELVAVLDGHGYRWIMSTKDLEQVPRLRELWLQHAAMDYRNAGLLELADCAAELANQARYGGNPLIWSDLKGSAYRVAPDILASRALGFFT